MTTRTIEKTVTFMKPFVIGDFDEVLPPGDYIIETDEELIQSLSFAGYIRKSTMMRLPSNPGKTDSSRVLTVDPKQLEAALNRDKESGEQASSFSKG